MKKNNLVKKSIKKLYISGPFSLTQHISKKYDKNIYIFGEYHGFSYNCDVLKMRENIPIHKFLDLLFKENDKNSRIIDFYLETFEIYWENKKSKKYIMKLRNMFKFCVEYLYRNLCPYKNTRIHYTDIREYKGNDIISNLFRNTRYNTEFFNNDRYYQKIIELNAMFYDKNFGKYLIELIFSTKSMYKIKKEIERSIFSINKYIKFINIIRDQKYKFIENRNKTSKHTLLFVILIISSIIMDIYQIARIFKIFRDNTEPKDIIVYSGESHSESLRMILDYLNFKLMKAEKTYNKKTVEPKCLNITRFLPLF